MSSKYKPEMETGDNRLAKCSLVILKELTMIMQDLLKKGSMPATHLYKIIQADYDFKFNHLNDDQIKMVETLKSDGYERIDISLAYKIAKYFKSFIPPPSQGWGPEPIATQIEIGDDVERIRLLRNHFVHLVNTNISLNSFNKFFTECIKIGKRVDKYDYERTISGYQQYPLDPVLERHHLNALADIEQLKGKIEF